LTVIAPTRSNDAVIKPIDILLFISFIGGFKTLSLSCVEMLPCPCYKHLT
jgi:hypothetical protein